MIYGAWKVSPKLAFQFAKRFSYLYSSSQQKLMEEIGHLAYLDAQNVYNIPEAVPFLIQGHDANFELLEFWEPPPVVHLLKYIYSRHVAVVKYVLNQLYHSQISLQIFFMNQIIECIGPRQHINTFPRNKTEELVFDYLVAAAKKDESLRNNIEWAAAVYLQYEPEVKKKRFGCTGGHKPNNDKSNTVCQRLLNRIKENLQTNPELMDQHNIQEDFFHKLNLISATLPPKDSQNNQNIRKMLAEYFGPEGENVPRGIYLPTDPHKQVVNVIVESGAALTSAARVPVHIAFNTKSDGLWTLHKTACLFKVNDDIRNDQMALQMIQFIDDVFKYSKIPLYLRPYKVKSTITNHNGHNYLGGIIEIVQNCKSRHEIGKEGSASLYDYFVQKFGQEETFEYSLARKCFIESLAGYAVASYILQIKDRHNGNILIDNEGHIIHIDFGFIFNISPAGNLKFERPEFKMTREMIQIMGNETSESFAYFKDLVVKGFIMLREYADEFIAISEMTKNAGFTCFRKKTMSDLRNRFYLSKRLPKVARKVQKMIYWANNSIFTNWYDRIQLMQQKIEY